ncbi:ABC transporter ATP-binding protein [Radicibacter daui]|uniref:ABC transporter ATP-binding protein n=1 Tax=Radicibacter daui TaxID=3064829 RepID=UPI004046E89F
MAQDTLLEVDGLTVRFPSVHGPIEAVRDISFAMGREKIAIVGESGSGKSMTARAILDLIRPPGERIARSIRLDGTDLTRLSPRQMRQVRGGRITMVMQDPKYSLNPTMSVGAQLYENWLIHVGKPKRLSRAAGQKAVLEMLEAVQINDPPRVARSFPHELSGGMGQRVMIAMMLIPQPELMIADEPTSALDVTVQMEVLKLMDGLVARNGMGLLFISHDLPLVSRFCDRVLIMYRGRIVEECRADRLHEAQHPYTQGLLSCLPSYAQRGHPLATLSRDAGWEVAP